MALLELNNLTCGYGENEFRLKGVSFKVERGLFAGIIGPNGSGKTTLFRSITGILKPEKGEIKVNGINLKNISPKERSRIMAVVNQTQNTVDMTVFDYVLLGRLPYRNPFQFLENDRDIDIATFYMKKTGIWEIKEKKLTDLNGGAMQLVAITRALTQEPEILLLDEPTSHLDISHQVGIMNLLLELNSEMNLTVLTVMHDLNLAGEYCDKLIMLNNGSVFTQGPPGEVLTYENIEKVYNTVVITRTNPLSGRPFVILVSGKTLSGFKKEN